MTRLLRNWGVYDILQPVAVQPGNIWFRRWEDGAPIGLTKLVPEFEQQFGAPYWVVHRAHLHQALVQAAQAQGVTLHVDQRVTGVDFEKGTVETQTGTVYTSDLIVGCDGLKSITRKFFMGDADQGPRETPFCAYRSTVPMDLLLADPELRPLVEKPDLSLWVGEQRHVMSYPISGGKTFNMVLSHPDDGSSASPDRPQEELLQEMADNYKGWDPKLTKIISLIDKTAKWKLLAYPPVESWRHANGRYVLMGDACHAMLPYMSQGAAQAMEDAAALGRCVARAHTAGDIPAVTKVYEDMRKTRAYQVQARSALNGKIWHYADGADQAARDAGMAATLTGEHYIRSTNQWSDPATQIWLYNHDAEREADIYLDAHLAASKEIAKAAKASGIQDMIDAGLLARM